MENVTQNLEDREITVTRGDLRLVVSPYGASLRGLSRTGGGGESEEIITGYHGAANKVGGQGDVLIPFPGRVAQGRYTFDGQTYQMEKNDGEGPNAIHGFLRKIVWDSIVSENFVTFRTAIQPEDHAGYPFSLDAQVIYRLTDDGLAVESKMTNTGNNPAPVAAGFHPYFTVGSEIIDTDLLALPFLSYLEYQEMIPTGCVLDVAATPYDFRSLHAIGDVRFNTCYLNPTRDLDGLLRIRLTNPESARSLTVWMDKAFDYVVLYSGDPLPESHRRRSLAIEPMTCGSDAFNHPAWGLVTLMPAQVLSGAWGVTAK